MAHGQLGKALKRTSHEVSLYKTGETWNSVAIYTNFCSPEIEIDLVPQSLSDPGPTTLVGRVHFRKSCHWVGRGRLNITDRRDISRTRNNFSAHFTGGGVFNYVITKS